MEKDLPLKSILGKEFSGILNKHLRSSSIITPDYRGFYRGEVIKYDTERLRIIIEDSPGSDHLFLGSNLSEKNGKKYTYYGKIPSSDNPCNVLRLPFSRGKISTPLIETLSPSDKLQILKNDKGIFYITTKPGIVIEDQIDFSFDFIYGNNDLIKEDKPVDSDKEISDICLERELEIFLESLNKTKLSDSEKAKNIISYIVNNTRYPSNDWQSIAMNNRYINAGSNIFNEIFLHGISNCFWISVLVGELMKRSGIAHRISVWFDQERRIGIINEFYDNGLGKWIRTHIGLSLLGHHTREEGIINNSSISDNGDSDFMCAGINKIENSIFNNRSIIDNTLNNCKFDH